ARARVHLGHRDVDAVGVGHAAHVEPAPRGQPGRLPRVQVPAGRDRGLGDLRQADRRLRIPADRDHPARGDQVVLGGFQHPPAGPGTAAAAACTALPATTVDRDAQEPDPNGCSAVSPFTTCTASIPAPSASAAICASTVSMPCPSEVPPEYTCTVPVLLTMTSAVSCGPRPLFSRNTASPSPRCRPAARPRSTSAWYLSRVASASAAASSAG